MHGRQPATRWPLLRWWLLAAALGAVVLGSPAPAGALEVVTDYPGVVVEPGGTATFALKVLSPGRERVGLAVAGAPPGWRTTLRGGGSEITAVYSDPSNPPAVEVQVQVPRDAPAGTGRVVVRATGPSGARDLSLDLTVASGAGGAFALTPDFDRVRGGPETAFRFDLALQNNSTRKVTFDLGAEAPPGWTVDARPAAQQQAAGASVDAGGKGMIQVTANAPPDATEGEYPIRVSATGGGQTLRADLTVAVTGTPKLRLTTTSERLNVRGRAGRTTTVALVARNEGSAPLRPTTISATPPSGWEVTFEPKSVPPVAPGQRAVVTARIRPKGDAVAGDYSIPVSASGQGANENLELRFAVQTSLAGGFVGVALVVAALAGLAWVFRRYGRR